MIPSYYREHSVPEDEVIMVALLIFARLGPVVTGTTPIFPPTARLLSLWLLLLLFLLRLRL